ncbi:phospholipid-translocating P-type ATPase [Colletotrichum karsti]|uniref:Phospholipid-transporting ATPase n=1 Tax=Colletotrichum karsti TaxID=1095194 RepID=A0A9P6HYA7_9PEZI|nr:phospholipid-translocating P-type ATPase [Colletotrichum karsti]KAF9872390.1 phospholipid-translocating P-type ATPase [Colletotrichum karsti]
MPTKTTTGSWSLKSLVGRSPLPSSQDGRHISIRLGGATSLRDERRRGKPYISNAIKTSKYNVIDFLPRQLLYQFTRLANAYMLIISILQMIPGFSTTGKFTTLIPLVIFLLLIISKEGYYDWKRHRQDVAENNRKAVVLRSAASGAKGSMPLDPQYYRGSNATGFQWMQTTWKDVKVGDIVTLSRDDDVPADLVLLHADGENGFAYVDTMALDGETNLKTKQRPMNLPDCSTIEHIAACQADLISEDPNADLYRFDSRLTADGVTRPLTINEVIYRGSTIRNTPQAVGVVVNTGEECKIRMNANQENKPKRPALERMTNKIVLFLMMYVLVSSAAATVAYVIWKDKQERFAWYLENTTIPFADIFVGFIIMFNNVIPLSLYVGLEAIKLGQMTLISNDVEMYHKETDTPAGVNNTNNLDDLGQISYVFSDKTGTLTENIMKLRRINVAGTSWLHRMDMPEEPTDQPTAGSGLRTEDMLDYIRSRPNSPFSVKAVRYLLAMALCHTCLPERDESGEVDFQASSPDELALLRGARDMGFVVVQRSSQSVTVQMPHVDGSSSQTVFEILDVIEFSSKRKRMSIVVRCPDGRLWLICKGADTILLPRLRAAPADMKGVRNSTADGFKGARTVSSRWSTHQPRYVGENIVEIGDSDDRSVYSQPSANNGSSWIHLQPQPPRKAHAASTDHSRFGFLERPEISDDVDNVRQCFARIDDYATEGLRTLVYADRFLGPDEYREWKQLYHKAETTLDNRQQKIEEVSDLLEQSFDLLGASAVEDKLQKGVPETIEKLRQARIKIWMLTGDKRETAINIAHSTRICGPETSLFVLDVTEGDLELQLTSVADAVKYRLGPVYPDPSRSHAAVVIDGKTLTSIEDPSAVRLRSLFVSLMTEVDSVICCRASPAQKALLVNIIRQGPPSESSGMFSWLRPGPKKPITLAIGDGANDLAMISAANVGVGIAGREGQQAARVADFSISQFQYLSKLVLVHGRWNYYRTTRFILATFWKETFIYFPQALFQEQTGATGTSLYEPGSLTFVSFFTAACIVIIGTWEQDLKSRTLTVVPELFRYGQNAEGLNMAVYLGWVGNALIAGIVVYAGCWGGYADSEMIDDDGLYAQGFLTFVACVIWINIKLLVVELHHKTKLAFWSALGSVAAIWIYGLITAMVASPSSGPYSVKGGLIGGFGKDPAWWCTLILVVGFLSLMEMGSKALKQSHVLRAWLSRCWSSESKTDRRGGGVREGFKDWEPRLWQEMEKDSGVDSVLAVLRREELVG